MTYRFTTETVLDLVLDNDGDFHDGIDAAISASLHGEAVEVELTSTEPDESERVTERFRVTVERIEETR